MQSLSQKPLRKSALRFVAAIRIIGVNPYVAVSKRRAERLQRNWRRPMPVWVRINGKPQRKPWRKKEVLRYFAGLKSDEARQRNLARAMRVLSGMPGRFMARDWSGGQ